MSIYVITKRDRIKSVLQSYEEHFKDDNHVFISGETVKQNKEALRKLDLDTCSEKDVNEILNESWTELLCQECEKNVDKVIHIGDDTEFYGPVVLLCKKCLDKASNILAGKD